MMMHFCTVKENTLTVHYEPVNDLEEFVGAFLSTLSTKGPDAFIIFNPSVTTISSAYVGAIMSVAVMAGQLSKKLHVKCTTALARWIQFVACTGDLVEWITDDSFDDSED